jgi:hypothetical protein
MSNFHQIMPTNERLKPSEKINRCSCCRRVVLHVQTTKSKKKKEEVLPKKEPKNAKGFRALTSLSTRRVGSNDNVGIISGSLVASQTNICLECTKKSKEKDTTTTQNERKKEKVPLFKRLTVVSATSSISDKSRPRMKHYFNRSGVIRPLPREVVINGNIPVETFEHFRECSELGFDGISPRSTMDKMVPTRFTFDGIAPSESSGCDSNAMVVSDNSDGSEAAILNDLKDTEQSSVNDNTSRVKSQSLRSNTEGLLEPKDRPKGMRERTRTASTEMSIELSESDFYKTCGKKEKHSFFSLTKAGEKKTNPLFFSKDEAPESQGGPSETQFTSWFGFSSFLTMS